MSSLFSELNTVDAAELQEVRVHCALAIKTLENIKNLSDMSYYFREIKIENFTFPKLRKYIQNGAKGECIQEFLNAFKNLALSDPSYQTYSNYFERSASDSKLIREMENIPDKENACISNLLSKGYGYEQAKYLCDNVVT
jgi:hypothetical protein